jgi:SOS-response transcriptional repressor LexA
MEHVFVQSVSVEVALDRRLRRGDALIVESRQAARDGELIVADGESGVCVGRWAAGGDIVLYPLESSGAPAQARCENLHVRGVVIGVRSTL